MIFLLLAWAVLYFISKSLVGLHIGAMRYDQRGYAEPLDYLYAGLAVVSCTGHSLIKILLSCAEPGQRHPVQKSRSWPHTPCTFKGKKSLSASEFISSFSPPQGFQLGYACSRQLHLHQENQQYPGIFDWLLNGQSVWKHSIAY